MRHARVYHDEIVFEELDMVATRATISVEGRLLPSGSVGAIVLVHRDGQAFEVEFAKPFVAVVTLQSSEIEPAR